jgi:hypothetical protein
VCEVRGSGTTMIITVVPISLRIHHRNRVALSASRFTLAGQSKAEPVARRLHHAASNCFPSSNANWSVSSRRVLKAVPTMLAIRPPPPLVLGG